MKPDNPTPPIGLPVRYEERSVYGGDVPTMSGGMEVGYWSSEYAIINTSGEDVSAGIKEEAIAAILVERINEHPRLQEEKESLIAEAKQEIADVLEEWFVGKRKALSLEAAQLYMTAYIERLRGKP